MYETDPRDPAIQAAIADLPSLIPLERVAEFMDVSVRTVRRWTASGKLRVMRTSPMGSGRARVMKADLAQLLAGMVEPCAHGQ